MLENDEALREGGWERDGGGIEVVNGFVTMSGGLESAAYTSLFGGNSDDDGSQRTAYSWWGNFGEVPEKQYRSKTQYLLSRLPPITANLKRLEDAARADLAWFVSTGLAATVTVSVSMPALNTVSFAISIDATELEFNANWMIDA